MPSKVLCAAWSSDGSSFALGMVNGLVSLRNQQGEEILQFERKYPIWCLLYIPNGVLPSKSSASNANSNKSLETDLLLVGCWDKTLSFYR
jgi:intraflagellar transport protein 122